jgi:hypothetical protein
MIQHIAPCQGALGREHEAVHAHTLFGVGQSDGVLLLQPKKNIENE